MRIAIATTLSPYMRGGAEYLANNLYHACCAAGHQTEIIKLPFLDSSPEAIQKSIDLSCQEDFSLWGKLPDLVICLKFPAFYLQHDCKIMWVLHQHRSVYDLWNFSAAQGHVHSPEELALRDQIIALDSRVLNSALQNFTISKTVTQRLHVYNQVDSTPIYHPPGLANAFALHHVPSVTGDFIFAPSRFEPLKRQHLLLEALRLTKHPVKAVLCGSGSYEVHLRNFVIHHGLQERVTLLTDLSEAEVVAYYQHSLAVFFAPYDEDYGYVTLEAMLAGKAVITCRDSGGTNEFVVHEETGFIEVPEAAQVAERLDELFINRTLALSMGLNAKQHYQSLSLSWDNVLNHLLY